MSTSKNDVKLEYLRRLKELEYLWSNPLSAFPSIDLNTVDTTNPLHTRYLKNTDINEPSPITINDTNLIKSGLEAVCREYFPHQQKINEPKKRPASSSPEPVRKIQKTSNVAIKRSRSCGSTKSSTTDVPKNLQAQLECLDEETHDFLRKRLSDVDVVALPENLPTQNLSVISLAELYYLTQTLPLIKLLPGTHKTLMTENFESALLEGKVAVLFSRIEELKRSKKWSLRQPVRYYDPFVYAKRNKKSQLLSWDYILQEGKWMATDFKESSKYKKLCCVNIAQAVEDYWNFGRVMCVKRRAIRFLKENVSETLGLTEAMDVDFDNFSSDEYATYNTAQGEVDRSDLQNDDLERETIDISKLLERPDPADEIVPPELPQYTPQDIIDAGIDVTNRGPFKTHVNLNELKRLDQSIIRNLPKFTPFDEDIHTANQKSILTGETSVVPVSRMLYPMEDDEEWYKIVLRASKEKAKSASKTGLPDYQKGLFGVQPHRRLNFLRPPKPPLVKNIENRSPTIWLPQDDKLLIHYVAEYCFNWDLIAVNLQANSATLKRYESNIERRTPWSCFERYIQLNEKFQFSDMKGPNAYPAQQWLEHAHKAQSTTKRRISPLGVGIESIQRGHRRLRWASMFDAMRKTMRKRETALAKLGSRKGTSSPEVTSSSASNSGNGSTNNGSSANGSAKRNPDKTPTPSELSSLKLDRDKSMQEVYAHQQATRSKMMAAVNSQKNTPDSRLGRSPASGGGPTDMGGSRQVSQGSTRVPSSASSSPLVQRPQASRPVSQQSSGQGMQSKQPMGTFKRPTTPNGTPLTVEQIQRLLQIQKQRRLMQQQQAQTGNMQASNPLARKTLAPGSGQMTVGNGMAPGNPSSVAPGTPGSAMAKRVVGPHRMQFPPAQVSAIISSIQQKNPNLSKDQVTKLTASYLANIQQQQQQKYEQQQQQLQQTSAEASAATQKSVQARQAQLSRQRVVAQTAAGDTKPEAPKASKIQYEERKKLMMQQGGSQYGQNGKSTATKGSGNRKSGAGGSRSAKSTKSTKARAAER